MQHQIARLVADEADLRLSVHQMIGALTYSALGLVSGLGLTRLNAGSKRLLEETADARDDVLEPVQDQRDHERQDDRADKTVVGLLLFNDMDAVAELLVDIRYLLGEAGEGLKLAGDGRH